MDIFKKKDFQKLAKIHKPNCLSIYMPTHRTNAEGDGMYKDKTTLKNRLKEAEKQLKILEHNEDEISAYLKPVKKLMEDDNFWRKQSDGLALFYEGNELFLYTIPKVFTPYTHVSDSFYLKPMADLLHGSSRHFIMSLSLGDVSFYEATENTITPVTISDLVPGGMSEAVGGDYEEKHLEVRSGQGERGEAGGMFHGHGSGSESEKKKEALKYFRAIDKGIMQMLHDEDAPLVIACVDYLFPIYKEANSYKWLMDEHISGNFEYGDALALKEYAWDIVRDHFDVNKQKDSEKISALLNEGKAATSIEDVVPSAIIGRASALFIKEDQEVWGKYFPDDNKVKINEVRNIGDVGLLNKAAVETINHGGKVYIVPGDEMPFPNTTVAAAYRYEM